MVGSSTIRLNKFIADSGYCSRRKADMLISGGHVAVNGAIQMKMGVQVDPGKDIITIDGQMLQTTQRFYLAFHKPVGYITTRSDERDRKTIYDLIPEEFVSVDPAGRLDRASSGLLILSNDGDFLNQITHPRFHFEKVYEVTLEQPLTDPVIRKLQTGIMLEPEHKLAKMKQVERQPDKKHSPPNRYRMVLITGFNRQIRRTLALLGLRVISLKRIAFGPILLGNLKPGEIRALTSKEWAGILKPEDSAE